MILEKMIDELYELSNSQRAEPRDLLRAEPRVLRREEQREEVLWHD